MFLGPDEGLDADVLPPATGMLRETATDWREWVRTLAVPLEWQTAVIRAAITLKLCAYEETGAIVAAMTTSIPEAPHSGRNWDYRYCWLRDAYYVVQALNRLGAADMLENYLGYLRNLDRPVEGRPHPAGLRRRPGAGHRRAHRRGAARLSRHGAGARRQPGARTPAARRLRTDHAVDGAGVLRRAAAAAGDGGGLPGTGTGRRARLPAARPARRRPVGIPHHRAASTPIPRSCAGPPATGSRMRRKLGPERPGHLLA